MSRELDLRGKDYFTVEEAAHYCCVSLSQFKQHEAELVAFGFPPLRIMGKKVYRRSDLVTYIERAPEWRQSVNAAAAGISTGEIPAPVSASRVPLDASQRSKRKTIASSRKWN